MMTFIHFIAIPNTFILTMMILFSLSYLLSSSFAFVVLPTTTTTTTTTTTMRKQQQYPLPSFTSSSSTKTTTSSNCALHASNSNDNNELFKAGLLADESSKELAIKLASTKIRKVSDLKIWKEKSNLKNKSSISIRPKYWSFGGNDEFPIQDKANYSTDNPNCSEPWLGLQDFYSVIDNDTAAADIIFVSLAGGRAFIERDIAESVLNQWWNSNDSKKFDPVSFEQTVKIGQRDFITSWSVYVGVIGIAVTGIAFPNNPIELGLVRIVDMMK
ncbi:MAG: hypothetical protein ACI90V_013658 [Bacillariaceae sp.]|jgi:hypothetical protein